MAYRVCARRAVLDLHGGHDQAGRGVEPDRGERLGDRDHAGLDQDGRDSHRAVTTHRQQAGNLDEQHAVVGVRTGRRLEDRAAHGRVAPRFVHQEGPEFVPVPDEPLAALGHGGAGDDAHAAGHHPGGHALCVRLDGVDHAL